MSSPLIERWGASNEVIGALDRLRSEHPDSTAGRVQRVERTEVCVVFGDEEVRAGDGGLGLLCAGDWVVFGENGNGHQVLGVLERRSCLRRSTGADSTPQVLAANIDEVLIVVALDQPANPSGLERLLTIAGDSGALHRVVVTKSDLGDSDDTLRAIEAIGRGVSVISVSTRTGAGIDDLAATLLTGWTAALVGSSGAGKSSLVNALLGNDRLKIGAVRSHDGKGRHTTSWRELVALPGAGVVIDMPGIRSVGMWLDDGGLEATFSEISEHAERCRFSDCTHSQEPGCAVQAAITSRALDGRRLASYNELRQEAEQTASRSSARAARAGQRKPLASGPRSRPRSGPR